MAPLWYSKLLKVASFLVGQMMIVANPSHCLTFQTFSSTWRWMSHSESFSIHHNARIGKRRPQMKTNFRCQGVGDLRLRGKHGGVGVNNAFISSYETEVRWYIHYLVRSIRTQAIKQNALDAVFVHCILSLPVYQGRPSIVVPAFL